MKNKMKKIFNNKNLSDEEILYIIKRFQPLIIKASFINGNDIQMGVFPDYI